VRKIIFNQNAYYSFPAGSSDRCPPEKAQPLPVDVLGIICVSADNLEVLAHSYPNVPLTRLRYAIDPALFHPGEDKHPQIVYMPRKHADEARQVIGMLALRGALAGFEVVPLDGKSEEETARTLRQARIFLSFGYPEGFGLPPAEAMACGCLTVGYHGWGGREFFTADHGWPIEIGDILGYVRTVEAVLAACRQNPESLMTQVQAAARFIATNYSRDAYHRSVMAAWRELTAGTPHAA
jgi:hypothetical protein